MKMMSLEITIHPRLFFKRKEEDPALLIYFFDRFVATIQELFFLSLVHVTMIIRGVVMLLIWGGSFQNHLALATKSVLK